MICPHCKKNISAKLIAHHFASIGGSVSSPAKKKAAKKREQAKREEREK